MSQALPFNPTPSPQSHEFRDYVTRVAARVVLMHSYFYYSLRAYPRHVELNCRKKFVEISRPVPVEVEGVAELVLFLPLPCVERQLGRFQDANAADTDVSIEVVARVPPSVCHNHYYNLRKVVLARNAERLGDISTREDSNLLLAPQKKKTFFLV